MRCLLLLAAICLLAVSTSAQALFVSPSVPVVNQAATQAFIAQSPVSMSLVNTAIGAATASVSSISSAAASATAGNLLVVGGGWDSGSVNISSITDTAGNTYVQCAGAVKNFGGRAVDIWYAKNILGNVSNIVTINFSGGITNRNIVVLQYSGGDLVSPFEVSPTPVFSGSPATTGAFSPAIAGNLNVGVATQGSGGCPGSWTAGSSYTLEANSGCAGGDLEVEDRLNAPSGSQTGSILYSGGFAITLSIASFKPALGSAAAGTWSCSGCAGSINSGTGLYTAPATVTPQQTVGGYQLLPNQHIFNARIDSLPLRSDSATLMAGTGVNNLTYTEIQSFPINYCNGSTPIQNMTFDNPGNNGPFQIPAYPNIHMEGGWFSRWNGGVDHHLICIDTTNGTVQEMYQYRSVLTTTAASVNGSNVATLTFATSPIAAGFWAGESVVVTTFSGADTYFNGNPLTLTAVTATSVSYALPHAAASASTNGKLSMEPQAPDTTSGAGIRYLNSTYNLPNTQAGGSTDAAGLYLEPLSLRLQEVEQAIATGGTIKHALRMTIRNNFICGSSTANACYTGQPGGIRHIWPATAESFSGFGLNPYGLRYRLKAAYNCAALSSIAQILCTQLKQYGLILSDGGTDWSVIGEQAPWPTTILAAFTELRNAAIQGSTNFEVVDESGLQAAANPTCPIPDNCGLTTNTPETVTFTRTSDSATANVSVALMGPAVTLPNDVYYIQAGMTARQLTAFVHGGANNTVTWAVSPAITGGSLTSGGLLTPPATIAAVTSYTITATSTDNGAVAASMTAYIFPTGSLYFRPGATTGFTDSNGHTWAPGIQGTGGTLGCCGDLSGGPWGSFTDKQIYYYELFAYNDEFFNFILPNGTYNITEKFGTDQASAGLALLNLETQGVVPYLDTDIFVSAGGTYKPVDFVLTTTVTNNQLQIVMRRDKAQGASAIINAIQIDRTGAVSATTLTPNTKVTSGVTVK